MKRNKVIVTTVLSALLVGGTVTGFMQVPEKAKAKESVLVKADKNQNNLAIINKTASENLEEISSTFTINIPVIENESNTSSLQRINTIMDYEIIDFKNRLRNQFAQTYLDLNGEVSFGFSGDVTYEVTFNNDKIVSIPVTYTQYTGGAHSNTEIVGYNFNLETGEVIYVSDLFKSDFHFQKEINNKIKEEISKQPEGYFEDALVTVDRLDVNFNYFIKDNAIVVQFKAYELSSYSSGLPSFEIPLKDFENDLTPIGKSIISTKK
ncbi:DUF3298 and DUF4163 domain-containing protein [Bacillus sp. SCS-151]|uniref:DUF3298 and DUF4163 domain-containing protein n=1 Tax=Nanhaiella sioensis TaxID=3115293 RepID=UPI003979324E